MSLYFSVLKYRPYKLLDFLFFPWFKCLMKTFPFWVKFVHFAQKLRNKVLGSFSFIRKVLLSFPQVLRTMLFHFLYRWFLLTVANSRTESWLTWRPDRNWSFLKHTICCLGCILNKQILWCWYKQKEFCSETTELALFCDHFKSWICFWTMSLQKNLLVRFRCLSWFEVGGFWFTAYFYSKLLLMKQCYCLCVVLREKIICFMFPIGKELSLSLSFSLSSHQ